MLNTSNIMDMSFNAMLKELEPIALKPIPSGNLNDPDMMMKLDELLSEFANNHALVIYLWAYVSAKTNAYKLTGSSNEWSIAAKKKEALYSIASALKLKWDAVSRKITVRVETNYGEGKDKRNYDKPRDWRLDMVGAPAPMGAPSDNMDEPPMEEDDDLPPFHVGHVSPDAPVVKMPKPSGWDTLD